MDQQIEWMETTLPLAFLIGFAGIILCVAFIFVSTLRRLRMKSTSHEPEPDDALQAWETQYRQLWHASRWTHARLALAVCLVAWCFHRGVSAQTPSRNPAFERIADDVLPRSNDKLQRVVLQLPLVSLIVLGILTMRERRRYVAPERFDPSMISIQIAPATDGHDVAGLADLKTALLELLQLLNLAHRPTIVLMSMHARGLSVSESGRTIKCVIPAGFLKEIRNRPLRAKSKLAHELAHVVQRDSHFWLWLSIHAKYNIWAAVFVDTPVLIILMVAFYGRFVSPLEMIPHTQDVATARLVHLHMMTALAICGLGGMAMVFLHYRTTIKYRHMAELAADRAALLFGDTQEYLEFLTEQMRGCGSIWPNWFRNHPSPKTRCREANRFARKYHLIVD
jgi:hypothetical protein